MEEARNNSTYIVKRTFIVFGLLILAWILVWLLKVNLLDSRIIWLKTDIGGFTFWTITKIVIWIIPAFWLLALSKRKLSEVLNFSNWRKWLIWGVGIGFIISLTGFIPKYLNNEPLVPTEFNIVLFSVLIIAPVFEEFLMRGVILGNLQQKYSFWVSNIITAFFFLGLHLPGWYFMGTLMENITKPIGGVLSIFLLGFAFGYITYRGRSVLGGMIAHFLNNLSSL
jgi:membrane protease YdiL (CAAX protease family)